MNILETINERMNNIVLKEQYECLHEIFSDLDGYAAIKGVILSLYCYNNILNRGIGDFDILIARNQVNKIENILLKKNFINEKNKNTRQNKIFMLSSSHQIKPYYKKLKYSTLVIDINFDIFWGEYTGKRIDISEFVSDTIEMNIYGCTVKTLPPIKAMIQLVLHHYKDMNSTFLLATRKNNIHNMLKDVYHLIKNNLNTITVDKLYEISFEYEIIPYVYYILYHTGILYKDEILDKYISAFKTSEGEALLNCYGLNESERREWKCDFQTRLKSVNLYDFIKDDLTEKDLEKIAINKRIF